VRLLSDDGYKLLALFFRQLWILKNPACSLNARYRREELANKADLHSDERWHLA
jgi:hypothetical protein